MAVVGVDNFQVSRANRRRAATCTPSSINKGPHLTVVGLLRDLNHDI